MIIAHLNESLLYDKESGVLTWKTRPPEHFSSIRSQKRWNSTFSGRKAGYRKRDTGSTNSYRIEINLSGKKYPAARVAWMISHQNPIPDGMEVDHINGDAMDNRLANLRLVDHASNMRNQRLHRTSTTGVSGVVWKKRDSKFEARIRAHGKWRHIGQYSTLIDAVAARRRVEREYGFHENHGARRIASQAEGGE